MSCPTITPDMDLNWVRSLHEIGNPILRRIDEIAAKRREVAERQRLIAVIEQEICLDTDALIGDIEKSWTVEEIIHAGRTGSRPYLSKHKPEIEK